MVSELITAIAVGGALTGAIGNAIRAWATAPATEPFKSRKMLGGILTAGLTALAVVNFVKLGDQASLGYIALFVINTILGASVGTLANELHKN